MNIETAICSKSEIDPRTPPAWKSYMRGNYWEFFACLTAGNRWKIVSHYRTSTTDAAQTLAELAPIRVFYLGEAFWTAILLQGKTAQGSRDFLLPLLMVCDLPGKDLQSEVNAIAAAALEFFPEILEVELVHYDGFASSLWAVDRFKRNRPYC